MGLNDLHRLSPDPGAFADTVQSEPPSSSPDRDLGESLPGPDSDIGLDIGGDSEVAVAEKPTLSHIGRYALKTLLGEGGLGRVYEAWDPLLSRTVAVKTLQFDLDMPSRIALDRLLLNEARAAANLSHVHIVTVYDAGLSAHGVYIAMERLRGRDLRQMLDDGWRPTPTAAAQIVRRVADALAYAHARGIVHCDIKPGNIFLARKDKPKVLDFGIARAAHASSLPSSELLVAGSPHYLAPEQLSCGTVDARTDIYALGVVLYELLTGRKAFRGDSLEAIHAAVRAGQAVPVHELDPTVPRALSDLVARAMEVDPSRRPASASELSQALRFWAAAAQAESPPSPDLCVATPTTRPADRRGWFIAAGSVGLALAVWLSMSILSPEDPADAPSRTGTPSIVTEPPRAVDPQSPPASAPAQVVALADPPRAETDVKVTRGREPLRAAPARPRAGAPTSSPVVVPVAPVTGTLQIAVSPWGEVEVDGRRAGVTPPLSRLTLPEGTHTITIRNADFVPYTATVQITGDKPALVRHRFGS